MTECFMCDEIGSNLATLESINKTCALCSEEFNLLEEYFLNDDGYYYCKDCMQYV